MGFTMFIEDVISIVVSCIFFLFLTFGDGDCELVSLVSSEYDDSEEESSELDVPKVYSSEIMMLKASSALNLRF